MLQAAGGVAWCLDPCSRYRGGVTPERTCCRVSQGREQVVLDGEASSAFRALTPLFVSLSLSGEKIPAFVFRRVEARGGSCT